MLEFAALTYIHNVQGFTIKRDSKGRELNKGFGGKTSNVCAQFAFLAKPEEKPSLLTVVGKDSDGQSILNHFESININIFEKAKLLDTFYKEHENKEPQRHNDVRCFFIREYKKKNGC